MAQLHCIKQYTVYKDSALFLAFDFCRFCVIIRFIHPDTTANLSQIWFITFIFLSYSWERASIFPFECSMLNKGTTGTIFITSLVWHGPCLGIEPGTTRIRSRHSTTRLSRRRIVLEKYNIVATFKIMFTSNLESQP